MDKGLSTDAANIEWMTQEHTAKGAAVDAAKALVINNPESQPDQMVLLETIATMTFVPNKINACITESERRLVLFRLSMELTKFSLLEDAGSSDDGAVSSEWNKSPFPAHRLFLLEGISLILGPKSNNERFFVRFNSLLIRGETEAKWETISIVYNGNLVALQQSADGLRHSSDCSIMFVLIGLILIEFNEQNSIV